MRFSVERNALLRALGHVTGIVERRHTIPILSNVLVSGNPAEGLTIKATDLDMEAVETVPALIEQAGAVTISAHTFHDIVRKLPDGGEIKAQRKADGGRLIIAAGRANFELQILPADEFPDMGRVEAPHRFKLEQAQLKRLFEKPRFAISSEETRYYLNGIYLHALAGESGAKLRAVATDGHRLARVEVDCPEGAENIAGVIVPRKAVAEAIKLLEDNAAPVEIELSQVKIRIAFGAIALTSKLIDGSFPDYARVIPSSNKRRLTVENADLVKAVDRVSTLSSEKGRAVKLAIAGEALVVSASNPESGSATEEISADYHDEPLEIGFNARYLLDVAAQIDGPKAEFRFADSTSPALIADDGDSSALYVLMPLRV